MKNLLDVFTPLDITCYKNLALFKYKSFIALDEMEMFGYDFWNKYDGLYRECRSVVIDTHNLSIVLAPQKKFFNVNENPEMDIKVIRDKIKDAKKVEITNKLDGSNQNYLAISSQTFQKEQKMDADDNLHKTITLEFHLAYLVLVFQD